MMRDYATAAVAGTDTAAVTAGVEVILVVGVGVGVEVDRDDPDRPKDKYTLKKAAKCAALGAGLEAFRARNEPGPWMGRKGKRMALAAASGVAVGSVRQGSLSAAGWLPYAEALCTGFFAVEWYKKIGRDTHHEENALKEQEQWRRERRERHGQNDH
ncbi:hypothetical protein AC578_5885 [Pseudocercospora eumusae]|uniref:Uncharacterized protein n=1 Tax=Pseudocercospora eumusae TaxID=321146 RepID=A0A139HD46_9PEZI|nr:hypothetical protein AC578_5885 [Pseudocercospora eumusae]